MRHPLKSLWKTVFGDGDEYIDLFFSRLYDPQNALFFEQNGKVVSALHLILTDIFVAGQPRPAYYLCGAATLPEYRGRGLMGKLIGRAKSISRERGVEYIALIPAAAGLFPYYRKHGFYAAYSVQHSLYQYNHRENEKRYFFTPADDVSTAVSMHNDRFRAMDYSLRKDGRLFGFIQNEAELLGRQLSYVTDSHNQKAGYILYSKKNPQRIKELVCDDAARQNLLDAFMLEHRLNEVWITEPFNGGAEIQKGMLWAADGKPVTCQSKPYINVMLD